MHKDEHKINYCWGEKGENTYNRKPLKLAVNENMARLKINQAHAKRNLTYKVWVKKQNKIPQKTRTEYHTIKYYNSKYRILNYWNQLDNA